MSTLPHPSADKISGAETGCGLVTPDAAPVEHIRVPGPKPVLIGQGPLFVNICERTNITGPKAFARMIPTSIPLPRSESACAPRSG